MFKVSNCLSEKDIWVGFLFAVSSVSVAVFAK